MKLPCLLATLILLCGCTPHVEFDILNNTGTKLVLHTPGGAIVLEPGASIQLGEDELLLSKKEREFTYPILHLEHLGRVWEYYMPLRVDQEWRRVWTFLIQVDSDLGIRIAKPKQARPVPMDYAQPEGWPLIADAEVTSISGERQR